MRFANMAVDKPEILQHKDPAVRGIVSLPVSADLRRAMFAWRSYEHKVSQHRTIFS